MALHKRKNRLTSFSSASSDAPPPVGPSEVTPLKDDAKDTREGALPSKLKPGPPTVAAKGRETFRVTRFVILRLVGLVYFVAFLGARHQNLGLMGKDGLIPAHEHWTSLLSSCKASKLECFKSHPSLYWFLDVTMLEDETMDYTALIGMTLSMLVVLGLDSFLVMIALWLLDFSIVTSAEHTSFYSYGWESQLLETGWLAIWLCDVPMLQPRSSEPSLPVLWLFRWLCARISVGAGLIKLRGAQCWQDKTCLYYHFETQPIPSPSSFFFHFLPKSVLRGAVHLDFFVQLYTIWLVLLPGWTWYLAQLRRLGGFVQAGFMFNIILSGNFAFLNHLTVVPALACLDDTCFPSFLRHFVNRRYYRVQTAQRSARKVPRYLLDLGLLALISTLSMPVVQNLLQIGGRQAMNTSFGSFKLVNSYGAFGSVGTSRYEPIIAVSEDGVEWTELELPCKPGNVSRRPCFCAPYHYRLDWNIWFIGFKPHQSMLQRRESWLFRLVQKLLLDDSRNGDLSWHSLLDSTAQSHLKKHPVKYVKADMYHYEMKQPLWEALPGWLQGEDVTWWRRTFEETLIRPVQIYNGSLAYANL